MLRRLLQLVVRMAPNTARVLWKLVPDALRRAAAPLVHPIAAGSRVGAQVLELRSGTPAADVHVLYDPAAFPEARAAEIAAGRRLIALPAGEDPLTLARRHRIVEAVVLCRTSDPRLPVYRRLGFRPMSDFGSGGGIEGAFPSVSVVIATWNNRALCETCLNGLARNTAWPRLEIIVVDNGSRDGTGAMLALVADRDPRVRVVSNAENAGFAAGTNQGLASATGEFVVLLNDDTLVGPAWLPRLVAHLEADTALGLVCPVTNQIGNAAKVATSYSTVEQMEAFAMDRAFAHAGEIEITDVVALFCAAGRRRVLESVGFLDQRYQIGLFEDDDLARTLRGAGYRLGIARDAFVHHVGQASFGKLSDRRYLEIWQENKRRFERKWGTTWKPPA